MDKPCYACRSNEGTAYYHRSKDKTVYCVAEWLCNACAKNFKEKGFILKKEK